MNNQLTSTGAKRWTACPTSLYLLRVQEHSLVMGDLHPRVCHATYAVQYSSYRTKYNPFFFVVPARLGDGVNWALEGVRSAAN